MRGIDELDVGGATVVRRADLTGPLAGTRITADGGITASLPTITRLAGQGARVLICAHLGRPAGGSYAERAVGGPSLQPVADRLAELLGQDVPLAADVAGESAAAVAATLHDGGDPLTANGRCEPAETTQAAVAAAGLHA